MDASDKKPAKTNNYHHGDLRSVLISAAETELSENGIHAFSLRAVAKRAGVSHGAPAHHFEGKRGLLTALAAVGYNRMTQIQSQHIDKAKDDPTSKITASGMGYINFAIRHPALFRLMFSSDIPDRSDPIFSKASLTAFQNLISDVRDMTGAHPMENTEARLQLMASWSMVHGLAELMISGRGEIPLGFSKLTSLEREQALSKILLKAWQGKTVRP